MADSRDELEADWHRQDRRTGLMQSPRHTRQPQSKRAAPSAGASQTRLVAGVPSHRQGRLTSQHLAGVLSLDDDLLFFRLTCQRGIIQRSIRLERLPDDLLFGHGGALQPHWRAQWDPGPLWPGLPRRHLTIDFPGAFTIDAIHLDLMEHPTSPVDEGSSQHQSQHVDCWATDNVPPGQLPGERRSATALGVPTRASHERGPDTGIQQEEQQQSIRCLALAASAYSADCSSFQRKRYAAGAALTSGARCRCSNSGAPQMAAMLSRSSVLWPAREGVRPRLLRPAQPPDDHHNWSTSRA